MIRIQDSTWNDVEILSESLREQDKLESLRMGFDPVVALEYSFTHGFLRRTALLDDKPVAMWGVCGTPLGIYGMPYLITGDGVLKVSPITFSRIYKKEVEVMKQLYPHLENFVDESYLGAVRMLKIAGFELSEPLKINGHNFLRFSMKGNI